jgi:hypothetical protein
VPELPGRRVDSYCHFEIGRVIWAYRHSRWA